MYYDNQYDQLINGLEEPKQLFEDTAALLHFRSNQVKNPPKTKNYSHLEHHHHVRPAQRAGYGHFFLKLSGYHVVS